MVVPPRLPAPLHHLYWRRSNLREAACRGFFLKPVGRLHQALREQADIEAQVARSKVYLLFRLGQQIHQQGAKATSPEAVY